MDTTTQAESARTETAPIRLQGIGFFRSFAAGDLRVGDVTVWNYGHEYRVTAIVQASAKFISVTMAPIDCFTREIVEGRVWVKRMKMNRPVAVARETAPVKAAA